MEDKEIIRILDEILNEQKKQTSYLSDIDFSFNVFVFCFILFPLALFIFKIFTWLEFLDIISNYFSKFFL